MLRKTIMVLTLFLVGLLVISAVSAGTDNATNTVESTDETVLSSSATDELKKDNEINDPLSVDANPGKLKMDTGEVLGSEINVTGDSFENISQAISNSENGGIIYLHGETYKGNGEQIIIDKNLTIIGGSKWGDGKYATLDAQRLNKIFWIDKHVTIHGIKFINGRLGDEDSGGAIYVNGDCTLIDCIFTNNYAEYGGAIYVNGRCTLIDCNFTNNGAEGGGATQWSKKSIVGGIINCTFENNTALFAGGANDFGNAITNVTLTGNFINNTALFAGANLFNELTNVTLAGNFINNTALLAGANMFVKVTNVTLTGNYINNNLKQRFIDAIDDDDFINKFINENGLSTIYIGNSTSSNVIRDSIFINNDPITVTNGTITAVNNWFGNNVTDYNVMPEAGIDLDNWLFLNGTADLNPVSLEDTSNIIFKLSRYDGKNVSSYDNSRLLPIKLDITSTLGSVNPNQVNLNEIITYTPEMIGVGSITASFENVLCTIEIEILLDCELDAYFKNNITYGEDAMLVIEIIDDATGFIEVYNINDEKNPELIANVTVEEALANGINITGLKAGNHTFNIKYSGDESFGKSSCNASLNVEKTDAEMEMDLPEEAIAGEGIFVDFKLSEDATGNITVFVNDGEVDTVILDKGKANITIVDLTDGTYTITAIYNGDINYNKANRSASLKVKIAQYNMTVNATSADGNITVNITLPDDSWGNVTVRVNDNEKIVPVKKGTASARFDNLPPGETELSIEYSGDDKYFPNEASIVVNNTKKDVILSANKLEMYVGDGSKFAVLLTDSAGNPISGKGIKVNITGKTYTIITNASGIAVLPINLKGGSYPVYLWFNGDGVYNKSNNVSSSVEVYTKTRITGNKDLVKKQGGTEAFKVRALDKYGKPVKAYAKVKMTVAGKTYTIYTDANGYASLPINLKAGKYTIKTEYGGTTVTNTITVKSK